MSTEPMYMTISVDEYRELTGKISLMQNLIMRRSFENSDLSRQNVADTKTIVRLQSENDTLKKINAKLQNEITEMWAKCQGRM